MRGETCTPKWRKKKLVLRDYPYRVPCNIFIDTFVGLLCSKIKWLALLWSLVFYPISGFIIVIVDLIVFVRSIKMPSSAWKIELFTIKKNTECFSLCVIGHMMQLRCCKIQHFGRNWVRFVRLQFFRQTLNRPLFLLVVGLFHLFDNYFCVVSLGVEHKWISNSVTE